jgi:translation initiation factor eIF-2B subunit delta
VLSNRDNQSRAIIDEAIRRIASDNTSGAAEILRRAGLVFTLLNEVASEPGADNLELARQAVIETCTALATAQSDMTPLLRLASRALSAARTARNARGSLKAADDAARNFIANAKRAALDAAFHAATLIRNGATVLTHSRSSTVLAAFVEAKRAGQNFSVVATESRPMLEGRALAEAVSTHGIPITLIADAAAVLALDKVDLVMVGADKITPVNLVNKIGTRMIALAAHARSLPAYAVCDSSKFISEDYFGSPSRHSGSPDELWPYAPSGVVVVNSYFERTPIAILTGIVTEDGSLSIAEAARRAEEASIDSELVTVLRDLPEKIK